MRHRLILFLSLMVLILLFWITMPSKKVEVIFCDVGQGDAILITYKNWQMLVDSGPNNKKVLTCLERNLPFWDKKIEVLLITHGDSDHSGGVIDIFKYYKISNFFSNGDLEKEIEQKKYSTKLNTFDVIKTNMIEFEIVNSWENYKDDDDKNKKSIAGILSYKDIKNGKIIKVFLTGDITADVERRLVWQKVLKEKIDVLKVSHHGSKNGTSEELLEVLKPEVAVISVGSKNRFGHPAKEVLERLKNNKVEIKRTDLGGEVHLIEFVK
jgi:competence protein ComEC